MRVDGTWPKWNKKCAAYVTFALVPEYVVSKSWAEVTLHKGEEEEELDLRYELRLEDGEFIVDVEKYFVSRGKREQDAEEDGLLRGIQFQIAHMHSDRIRMEVFGMKPAHNETTVKQYQANTFMHEFGCMTRFFLDKLLPRFE